jgi:hypothetical protein
LTALRAAATDASNQAADVANSIAEISKTMGSTAPRQRLRCAS